MLNTYKKLVKANNTIRELCKQDTLVNCTIYRIINISKEHLDNIDVEVIGQGRIEYVSLFDIIYALSFTKNLYISNISKLNSINIGKYLSEIQNRNNFERVNLIRVHNPRRKEITVLEIAKPNRITYRLCSQRYVIHSTLNQFAKAYFDIVSTYVVLDTKQAEELKQLQIGNYMTREIEARGTLIF